MEEVKRVKMNKQTKSLRLNNRPSKETGSEEVGGRHVK